MPLQPYLLFSKIHFCCLLVRFRFLLSCEWNGIFSKIGKSAAASDSRIHFVNNINSTFDSLRSDPFLDPTRQLTEFGWKIDKHPNELCRFDAVRYVNKALLLLHIIKTNTHRAQTDWKQCEEMGYKSERAIIVCVCLTGDWTTVSTLKSNKSVLVAASSSSASSSGRTFSCVCVWFFDLLSSLPHSVSLYTQFNAI